MEGNETMNFNYSYRAFLITALLCGSLILILYSIRLRSFPNLHDTENYDVEILAPEIVEDEIEIPVIKEEATEIETNRAFNQNEEERVQISRQSRRLTEETKGKLAEIDEALRNTESRNSDYSSRTIATKKSEMVFSNAKNESEDNAVNAGGNRRTNIFYNLPGREALQLPNPVYTCAASGTVVINIEVDQNGRVTKATANRTASTTSNQCLFDAAKEYSGHAIFSSSTHQKQSGTITFIFPGQD